MTHTRQRRAAPPPPPYPVDADGDRLYTEDDYAAPQPPIQEAWEPTSQYPPAPPAQQLPYAPPAPPAQQLPYAPPPPPAPPQEAPPAQPWAFDPYAPPVDYTTDAPADELLDEELLTDEELQELTRSRWAMLAGLGDFAGVIAGAAAVLVLVALLASLVNWLTTDISQSFTLLQMRF